MGPQPGGRVKVSRDHKAEKSVYIAFLSKGFNGKRGSDKCQG
jgi:hypothetical protein